MRNTEVLAKRLEQLGLSKEEAAIFMQLLEKPNTHLAVSRVTGIARSNVYRIVAGMIDRGIVHEVTTDTGKLLSCSLPGALEHLVAEQEVVAQARRETFNEMLPLLQRLQSKGTLFTVRTYSGLGGLKQMLWNELKAKTEILLFSADNLNHATGEQWAENYRHEIIKRNLRVRGIENFGAKPRPLSMYEAYDDSFQARFIDPKVLAIQFEITVYDDTVAIYNALSQDVHTGTETVNPMLVNFVRQIFEHYWSIASEE